MARVSYPNLIDDLAIVKGETYRKLIENSSILFDGDLTTATLSGQIRNNYVDNAGQLLGTFSFETSTYNQQTNKTLIKPYLTEFATINLPSTPKYSTGRQPSVKTNLVYDIELLHNGRVIKYSPGFVQVIGEVTGGVVSYNPAEEWNAGIASVELLSTVGFTKTYVIWGDEAKTVNLGTFAVIDTQPTNGVAGFQNVLQTRQTTIPGLDIPVHDDIVLSYTGDDLTGVSYRLDDDVVATITLTYNSGRLTNIVRS